MSETRPPAFFIGDHPSLDFANTWSTPAGKPTDWLVSGDDMLAWLSATDLVGNEALDDVRASSLPGQLDAAAAQIRALRDWFRGFVLAHKGKPLRAGAVEELAPLNRILARDDEYWQVAVASDGRRPRALRKTRLGLKLVAKRRWRSPDDLLFPLARTMATLICEADFKDVRMCEGKDCTLLFLDRTRARRRRWCSMALCGNRAKQAAHRSRLREG